MTFDDSKTNKKKKHQQARIFVGLSNVIGDMQKHSFVCCRGAVARHSEKNATAITRSNATAIAAAAVGERARAPRHNKRQKGGRRRR